MVQFWKKKTHGSLHLNKTMEICTTKGTRKRRHTHNIGELSINSCMILLNLYITLCLSLKCNKIYSLTQYLWLFLEIRTKLIFYYHFYGKQLISIVNVDCQVSLYTILLNFTHTMLKVQLPYTIPISLKLHNFC